MAAVQESKPALEDAPFLRSRSAAATTPMRLETRTCDGVGQVQDPRGHI